MKHSACGAVRCGETHLVTCSCRRSVKERADSKLRVAKALACCVAGRSNQFPRAPEGEPRLASVRCPRVVSRPCSCRRARRKAVPATPRGWPWLFAQRRRRLATIPALNHERKQGGARRRTGAQFAQRLNARVDALDRVFDGVRDEAAVGQVLHCARALDESPQITPRRGRTR